MNKGFCFIENEHLYNFILTSMYFNEAKKEKEIFELWRKGYNNCDIAKQIGYTEGTPVALALFEDGIIVPGTTMIATITAAGDVFNISFENTIEVCGRSNATLSIGSVPSVPNFADLTAVGIDTQPPIVANATLSIEKIA